MSQSVSTIHSAAENVDIPFISGYHHKLTTAPVGEWNLWGRLREVIVNGPAGIVIPDFDPSYEKIADPPVVDLLRRHGGQLLRDADPELYAALEAETNELIAVYENHGVRVKRPRPMKPEEIAYSFGKGASNLYCCDPFWCVGRNIIETSWRRPNSFPQKWTVRELYQPFVDADPAVHLHACPMPSPGSWDWQGDYYFEVGDMLNVGDGNIILAYDTAGTSSNARGVEWARRILEADGFKVTVIELPDTGILHLFAVICIIGPGVAIAYEDAFPGRQLPEPLKGWQIVWCNHEEARATAPCAVNIDRKTVVLPSEAPKVCEEVARLGFNVIDIKWANHAMAAGGIRCATGVIHREID